MKVISVVESGKEPLIVIELNQIEADHIFVAVSQNAPHPDTIRAIAEFRTRPISELTKAVDYCLKQQPGNILGEAALKLLMARRMIMEQEKE